MLILTQKTLSPSLSSYFFATIKRNVGSVCPLFIFNK